jgi:hypothetical protein
MGIAYRLDKPLSLMTTVWDGAISEDDWQTHLEETFDDPDWPAVTRNLTDLRAADLSTISEAGRVRAVSMYGPHAQHVRGKKSAVIAGGNFDRARSFESHNEPHGLRLIVFNDLFNACTWLGIDTSTSMDTLEELRTGLREGAVSGSDAPSVLDAC